MPGIDLDALVARTRRLVEEVCLPLEEEAAGDIERAGGDAARRTLQDAARHAGVFAPHAPVEYGGLGLGMVDRMAVFEAAGRSVFGPLALNIAAPDEGNMHLLAHVASPEQKERYLKPLSRGDVRSAFAMTEPAPGAGSDPAALNTTARRDGDGWLISGQKRFITGADGATFFIVMTRTPDDEGAGATMFLVDAQARGLSVGRHIPTIDRSMVGGHCEVTFTDVRVFPGDVLGEVGQGFRNAQVRLGPARMTHVMRWLGLAVRAHEIAVDYASRREAFGATLTDLGMTQQLIADSEIDLAAGHALLRDACEQLDAGGRASQATSVAKVFGSEALCRVADRAMQIAGGSGMSEDLPLARIYREIRPFRVYDGPAEVHRAAIAARAVRQARARAEKL